MSNIDKFIKQTKNIISNYDKDKISLNEAASKISNYEEYLDSSSHPMLQEICDIAFHIHLGVEDEKYNKIEWQILNELFVDYLNAKWDKTEWLLSAVFGKYDLNRLIESYGILISIRDGQPKIESANKELVKYFSELSKKLNNQQTDQRYLENMSQIIPKSINKLKLLDISIGEFLMHDRRFAEIKK